MTAIRLRKQVLYMSHLKDADGDVIFFFVDPRDPGQSLRQSSPIVGMRRLLSAVLDLQGVGSQGQYVISTRNSEYQVRMVRDQAKQLAWLLGQDLVGARS